MDEMGGGERGRGELEKKSMDQKWRKKKEKKEGKRMRILSRGGYFLLAIDNNLSVTIYVM